MKLLKEYKNRKYPVAMLIMRFMLEYLLSYQMLSWDYPPNNGIKDYVDTFGIYPITCLTTLSEFEKDKLFRSRILKPLNKLIENIIFNFKLFRPGVDIKTLHNDCLSFVYGKFANFNPGKNTKSFSYFGTVAKHYLQGEKKELDKSIQVNLDYDFHRDEADSVDTFELHDKSDLETSLTLFGHVINSIEDELDSGHLSENDMKVGDAIIQIFKSHEILGAYNKNHVYQLIKENTGLQTKDITYSLSRFRVFYRLLKQDFIKRDDD